MIVIIVTSSVCIHPFPIWILTFDRIRSKELNSDFEFGLRLAIGALCQSLAGVVANPPRRGEIQRQHPSFPSLARIFVIFYSCNLGGLNCHIYSG